MKSVDCPKCGRKAWSSTVQRWGLKGLDRKSYTYTRYRHYAGSRKAITLKALEKLLRENQFVGKLPGTIDNIMRGAREQAGEKNVDHYVRVE